MSWEGTKLLTNGEHDSLWRNAFGNYIPMIGNSLRRSNAIECIKELYRLGLYSKKEYAKGLSQILESEKFERLSDEEISIRLYKNEEES